MFAVISGALSSSIRRFIRFELGRGNKEILNRIFCTSVNIQIVLGLLILILGETIGIWFLNTQLNISSERIIAANWVFQCSIVAFVINLISIPYNAAIIAHERMKAFAYVSILEAMLKLGIVYLLLVFDFDKLILYSILNVIVSILVRFAYNVYCTHNFEECSYHILYDKNMFKEMTGFASWNFLTNGAYILNTQGVNILINMFFGVAINAARGVAAQADAAIMQFVNNFTNAINPQIIKSYASGEKEAMFRLVCRGAKFSYFMLLLFAIPFICEADAILNIWLNDVPPYAGTFLRLTVLTSMANVLGNAQYTACQATGNIKTYTIIITLIGCLVFPVTWLLYNCGLPVESTYYVYFFIYIVLDLVRLFLMRSMLGFPIKMFVCDVFGVVLAVTFFAVLLPVAVLYLLSPTWWRIILTFSISTLSVSLSVYFFGLSKNEKELIVNVLKNKLIHKYNAD